MVSFREPRLCTGELPRASICGMSGYGMSNPSAKQATNSDVSGVTQTSGDVDQLIVTTLTDLSDQALLVSRDAIYKASVMLSLVTLSE
jgi:hypothetical protein